MLSLDETIRDLKSWENTIREVNGITPEGIRMARKYLRSLRAIIDNSENPDLIKKIQEFKEWLQKQEVKND